MSQRNVTTQGERDHPPATRPDRHAGITLVGIVALALRLYGIAKESLWLDEATSLMLARMDLPTLVQWTANDIHPPLYYILLHFWIFLGEGETILRGLSVLASVLNVLVIYALGRTLFGWRTGLLAALLLAVDPFHIWYAQEARMYAWLALFVSLSMLMAFRMWRGARATDETARRHPGGKPARCWRSVGGLGRWADWAGYVLATAAALYTHYYAVFAVLLANLFFAYLWLRRRLNRGIVVRWITAQAAWFALFLPWFPIFLLPITVGGGGWVTLGLGRPSAAVWGHTAALYMVGTGRTLLPALVRRAGYLLFALALAFAVGLWLRRNPRVGAYHCTLPPYDAREATGFCLAYLILPLGIAWASSQVFKPMYSIRYMLPFLIPFLLLVARGVRSVPLAAGRVALLLGLIAVMGMGIVAQVNAPDKPDWRGLAARLTAQARPGDVLLFVPGWHAKPFDYYAHGALDYYEEVPVPVDQDRAWALAAVDEAIAGHTRVWLIWETDHYTDPQGTVYGYLAGRWRLVSDEELPLVGRLVLFESSGR